MLGTLQLSHSSSCKNNTGEGAKSSSQKVDPVEVWKLSLDDVKGAVCTTQKVTIPLFGTINVCTSTSVKGHCMGVHVLKELLPGSPGASSSGVHSNLWGVASWVLEGTHLLAQLEHLYHGNTTKAVVGQVAPAIQVPPEVHPTRDY